jgi:hypothetical protein
MIFLKCLYQHVSEYCVTRPLKTLPHMPDCQACYTTVTSENWQNALMGTWCDLIQIKAKSRHILVLMDLSFVLAQNDLKSYLFKYLTIFLTLT